MGFAHAALCTENEILRAHAQGQLSTKSLLALPAETTFQEQEKGRNNAPPLRGDSRAAQQSPEQKLLALKKEEEKAITDKAFPLLIAKWPFDLVVVCWENPPATKTKEMTWVKAAVEGTWQRHSSLKFTGWKQCNEDFAGLRIRIDDSGPHVKYLGKYLRGLKDGMVLNFTFKSWSPSCATSEKQRQQCIESIAVHEFGHALGFAHEQNRPDTPGDCKEEPQGNNGNVLLTPWDRNSVMNYCNPTYNNNGQLSDFDIKAVQYIYGLP
jgi:hypothetical protein